MVFSCIIGSIGGDTGLQLLKRACQHTAACTMSKQCRWCTTTLVCRPDRAACGATHQGGHIPTSQEGSTPSEAGASEVLQ